MSDLIEELDVESKEPIEDVPVAKAEQNPGPMKLVFDATKPIANAPEGTIKTTMKSDLIPMQGSPIPSDPIPSDK